MTVPKICHFCPARLTPGTTCLLSTSKDHVHACVDCASEAVGVRFVVLRPVG